MCVEGGLWVCGLDFLLAVVKPCPVPHIWTRAKENGHDQSQDPPPSAPPAYPICTVQHAETIHRTHRTHRQKKVRQGFVVGSD